MKYQEFVDKIIQELKEFYGNDAEVTVDTVIRNNNGYREAIHIRYTGDDGGICPEIYLDNLYESYIEEKHEPAYYVGEVVQMRKDSEPSGSIRECARKLLKWENVKGLVYPVLVSLEANDQFLEHYVHTAFLDLAVIYEVRVKENEEGIASSKVTYGMLNAYGISREELHRQALQNMRADGYKMDDMMKLLFGPCERDSEEEEPIALEQGKMYILTNHAKHHGAACLLYEEFLKEKLRNTTAFILPSSIHETLFVPVAEGMTAEEFDRMICEVNETYLLACEKLSNHCYLWDGKEQKVKMAA